ncbi:hypothetical protein ACFXG6_33075 [Streptomyces roseus]
MPMTIRVYDVNGQTGEVVHERAEVVVGPGVRDSPPMNSLAFPPCQCTRCQSKGEA